MREKVVVLDKKGKDVIVGCDEKACQGCHCSFFCSKKTNTFEAINSDGLDLNLGDEVEIDIPSGKSIKATLITLGFPLIMFIPGYFFGTLFSSSDIVLLGFALLFVALGFLISGLYFKLKKKAYTPVIIKRTSEKREEKSVIE